MDSNLSAKRGSVLQDTRAQKVEKDLMDLTKKFQELLQDSHPNQAGRALENITAIFDENLDVISKRA